MAREATITQEQVNAAAGAIRASGAKPTARAVRDALGTGSMATVLKFFQAWKAGQVRAEETPVVLPAALQRALVDFIGQEVAGAKVVLQEDLATEQQANGDLIAENERQASTIEAQANALDTAQAEKAELAGRLAQVEADLSKAMGDMATERQAAEHARTELAKAILRLEALPRIESEAERLHSELETIRTAKIAAEQAAAVAIAKLEGMTDRANKAEAAAEKAEKQAATAQLELNNTRIQVHAQQCALDAAVRDTENARAATAEARAKAERAGEEAAELRGRLGEQPTTPIGIPSKTDR